MTAVKGQNLNSAMPDILDRLTHAMKTAQADDRSMPGSATRARHAERLATMTEARQQIEEMRKALEGVPQAGMPIETREISFIEEIPADA